MSEERTTPESEPAKARPRSLLGRASGIVERAVERGGDIVWRRLKRRPLLGVALAGVGGLVIAEAVGVGEIALGVAAAYGAYLVLKRREPPSQAVRDVMTAGRELGF
jgi:hypothetical protein